MHDEVSETENIRNNLAIERIIVGGCDILLDVNQVFIRKGSVLQVLGSERHKTARSRIGSFRGDKEVVRQCYLFSNHMLICTRTSGGKLTLVEVSFVPELFKIKKNLLARHLGDRKDTSLGSDTDRRSQRTVSVHCGRWW